MNADGQVIALNNYLPAMLVNTVVRRLAGFAVYLLLTLGTASAIAWGSQGHQVIAGLASAQLTPKARDEVNRLLALEPGETLVSISTWADEHKNPATARWHYVNFPRDSCTYDAQRDCPDSQCITAAIERQAAVLVSGAPDDRKLSALKYVVHLVGDVYQPLHAGYRDDKGGNTYQLQAFMRGSNLHALWDSGIIKNMNEDSETMTARLIKQRSSFLVQKWSAVNAAEKSCMIVGSPGFYPARQVGLDYIERFTPLLEQRLKEAASSLANLLNSQFK